MNTNEFKKELKQFTGIQDYHRLTLLPLLATDGVKYFINKTQTHWLINNIAATMFENLKEESFVTVTVKTKNNKCTITYEDGSCNKLKEHKYKIGYY